MIKVTDKAAKKLKELRESENYSSDHNVRVKVKSGGCSGLQYDLNFDNIISDKDDYFEDNGLKIIVDKKSLFYLLGTRLYGIIQIFENGIYCISKFLPPI